jgi:hypothetical protein
VSQLATIAPSFAVPQTDAGLFSTLPIACQEETRLRLRAVFRIESATRRNAEALAISRECCHLTGFSPKRLLANHAEYMRSGDWTVLVNKAKAGAQWWKRVNGEVPVASNRAFLEWVKAEFERDQRGSRNAWRGIIRRWKDWLQTGDSRWAIKGYSAPPKADPRSGEIPLGWSYENLMRLAQPDDVDLTTARIGTNAAAAYRPPVFTSRHGLALGEFIQFDDHEFNLKIMYPGQRSPFRPRGFFAIDVLSACHVGHSFKPTLWDDEEEKKRALTEKDFTWFVIHLLMSFGYRTDERKTTFIVEHGTAAIREAFEQRIMDACGGHVQIRRSGILGETQMAGLFEGRGRGNFRFKALIESSFSMIDNAFAALPAQVGKDRLHAPEQMHGIERQAVDLIKAMETLSPERAALLRLPTLTWKEFLDRAIDIFKQIERRTDHELEGWEKCGFVAKEWRMDRSLPWLPLGALDKLESGPRSVALALIQADAALTRVRKMSPAEVVAEHKHGLQKVPAESIPALVGLERLEEMGREIRVNKGLVTISGRELGPDEIHYLAVGQDGMRLPNGEKFLGLVNPHNPDRLVACDAQGRVKAVLPLWNRPARNDAPAVLEQMGAQAAWDAARRHAQDARHSDYAAEHKATLEHNRRVLDTATPLLPAEIEAARKAVTDTNLADQLLARAFEND